MGESLLSDSRRVLREATSLMLVPFNGVNDVSGQEWVSQRGPNIRDFGRHQNSASYARRRQEGGNLLIYGEA